MTRTDSEGRLMEGYQQVSIERHVGTAYNFKSLFGTVGFFEDMSAESRKRVLLAVELEVSRTGLQDDLILSPQPTTRS